MRLFNDTPFRGMTLVVLSETNLKTLLIKLGEPNSQRMIAKGTLSVVAEKDEDHYEGVERGRMDDFVEERLATFMLPEHGNG